MYVYEKAIAELQERPYLSSTEIARRIGSSQNSVCVSLHSVGTSIKKEQIRAWRRMKARIAELEENSA